MVLDRADIRYSTDAKAAPNRSRLGEPGGGGTIRSPSRSFNNTIRVCARRSPSEGRIGRWRAVTFDPLVIDRRDGDPHVERILYPVRDVVKTLEVRKSERAVHGEAAVCCYCPHARYFREGVRRACLFEREDGAAALVADHRDVEPGAFLEQLDILSRSVATDRPIRKNPLVTLVATAASATPRVCSVCFIRMPGSLSRSGGKSAGSLNAASMVWLAGGLWSVLRRGDQSWLAPGISSRP